MPIVNAGTGVQLRSHAVYVIIHPSDGVIYVGCTVNFDRRIREHARRRPEFAGCDARIVTESVWRMDAEAKEAELIELHQPRFNKVTPKKMSGYAERTGLRDCFEFIFGGAA